MVKPLHFLIALDKALFYQKVLIFFLFLNKNMFWNVSEVPHRGASNEYPQHNVFMEK